MFKFCFPLCSFIFWILINFAGLAYEKRTLDSFYKERDNQPVWMTEEGFTLCGQEALNTLSSITQDGLDPQRYSLLFEQVSQLDFFDWEKSLSVDRALTQAFLDYISIIAGERNNLRAFDKDLYLKEKSIDEMDILKKGLASKGCEWMRQLAPQHTHYQRLKKLLAIYQEKKAAGGWPSLPPNLSLKKGHSDPHVKMLRQQLIAQDMLEKGQEDSLVFDEKVATALTKFQSSHGLHPTGFLNQETIKELNISVETRMKDIALNLERWRWLPMELGERYIIVNIPAYELYGIHQSQIILKMPIIVGRSYRRTPVFTSVMTAIILNPPWIVPHSIAINDKLPHILKRPGLLRGNNYRVFTRDGRAEVPIESIKWGSLSKNNFPYILRQEPGAHNPLGKIKFNTPNPFSVYLHGTSNPKLFQSRDRAKSSGCIRVESPNTLALFALNGEPKWTLQALQKETLKNTTRSIFLPQPLPVYLTYMTVWVDEKGIPHFAQDIYRKNESVEKLLKVAQKKEK